MSEVWNLSRGFLPAKDPIQQLPRAFSALDEFGAELPKLLAAGALGKQIKNLPILDPAGLNNEEAERAMMLSSFIGHAFVYENWRDNDLRNIISANIGMLWCKLAERLDRPPVLSYPSYSLYNWKRIEKNEQVVLGNIVLLQNFYAGLDEEWFILPHVSIEREAMPAIQSVVLLEDYVRRLDLDCVILSLHAIHEALQKMNEVMIRIPEGCDPYIYYNRVRPFLAGWARNKCLPDGVIYEGVPRFKGKPQKYPGETGAQSGVVPELDIAFGVSHADTLSDGSPDILKSYLLETRTCMPKEHRAFLANTESFMRQYSLREFVLKNKDNPELVGAYNADVEELIKFSDTHYGYAVAYIHTQPQKGANPTDTGTGGTPFMKYLKKHRDEREACLIS